MPKITICRCAYRDHISSPKLSTLLENLKQNHIEYEVIDDLCHTAVLDIPKLQSIAKTTVVACHPRAVKSLFERNRMSAPLCEDIRNNSVEDLLGRLNISVVHLSEVYDAFEKKNVAEGEWEAWYPVIDYPQCVDCSKCYDFCLFGVYTIDNGKVLVTNPQQCKNNCPACARNCPTNAIIFPKYPQAPINGSDASNESPLTFDVSAMTNGLQARMAERRRRGGMILKKG